jgi:pyruvate/2-oxoglutarate/acetoin dehydrogenase E1 component
LVQVINLRTLKPIDRDAIVKSVSKTHRVVVVEEGWPQSGVASGTVTLLLLLHPIHGVVLLLAPQQSACPAHAASALLSCVLQRSCRL